MIIKLTGADFSTDNIGTIDLRTVPSASTQIILDYYGKSWTLPQKLAIEDFLIKKAAWSFASKIKKLVLPILGPEQTINNGTSSVKGFYDLITESILPLSYGGAYTDTRQIVANGFIDTNLSSNGNNTFRLNFGTPTSWQNVHFSAYYHKTRNELNKVVVMANDFIDGNIHTSHASFGNTTKIQANFDSMSITTRGLRLLSYNGTNITGLAANLPFSSVSGSGVIDSSGDFDPWLLTRFDIMDDTTISLLSFGEALSQEESVIYNSDINTLMNALWTA